MINYTDFIVAFVAFLGLIVGEILARISPEEMKPGRKYFIFFEVFFIFVICLLGLILFKINLFAFVVGIILGFLVRLVYPYFAGILFSGNLFLFSILVFIYGLFYGTLDRPKWKFIVLDFLLFFLIGVIVQLFELDAVSLCVGGLITCMYFKIKNYKKLKIKTNTKLNIKKDKVKIKNNKKLNITNKKVKRKK